MIIKFPCPHCGGRLSVDESFRGRTVKCPKCSNSFILPADLGFSAVPSSSSGNSGTAPSSSQRPMTNRPTSSSQPTPPNRPTPPKEPAVTNDPFNPLGGGDDWSCSGFSDTDVPASEVIPRAQSSSFKTASKSPSRPSNKTGDPTCRRVRWIILFSFIASFVTMVMSLLFVIMGKEGGGWPDFSGLSSFRLTSGLLSV